VSASASVRRRRGDSAVRKRTVKYLSVCRDPGAYSVVIKTSPDSVIKSICNAALNVQRGDRVTLSKKTEDAVCTPSRSHRCVSVEESDATEKSARH
jgi:hypothetical protein